MHLAAGRFLTRTVQNPNHAAEELRAAFEMFRSAGRPPSALFAQIEHANALADARQLDAAFAAMNVTDDVLDRWQILAVCHAEAAGQINLMIGQEPEARGAFENAIAFAIKAGAPRKAETLRAALANC